MSGATESMKRAAFEVREIIWVSIDGLLPQLHMIIVK